MSILLLAGVGAVVGVALIIAVVALLVTGKGDDRPRDD
jgi:hypothetical protein